MKFLFLDVYKYSRSRISKDTAGGYGTENDLGDGLFGKTLSMVIKKSIFWPNLSFIQLMEEFIHRGHECVYKKQIGTDIKTTNDWDAVFICSSIVCFETEIEASINVMQNYQTRVFLCGSVGQFIPNKIPEGITILAGNYEFLPEQLDNTNTTIKDIINEKIIKVVNGKPENLQVIDWSRKTLDGNKNKILGGKKYFIPFITTRGCPYSCREYCTYPTSQGTKILQEPNTLTVNKLKLISKKFPGSHLVFRDPVFSINIKHTKALVKEIGDSNLKIDFSAELHLKNIDEELIELFKYANFTGLKFGIESAHQDVRDSVKRFSIKNDDQMRIVNDINKAKIKTVGMFILAQPDDTYETCMSTINYACDLNLNIAQFSIFTPYPGTPFYDRGQIDSNFSKYQDCNQFNLVYKHPIFDNKQARKLLETAYKRFIFSKVKRMIF